MLLQQEKIQSHSGQFHLRQREPAHGGSNPDYLKYTLQSHSVAIMSLQVWYMISFASG